MAHFMSIRPVTGLNTINNVLRLFRLPEIPNNARWNRDITKLLVARNLNMLFTQLRNEDVAINFEGLNNFTEETIAKMCFRRGININQS